VEYRGLLDGIGYVSTSTQAAVARSINQTLTLRNWLIGAYIIEFEQNGDDRAVYGDALIRRLAKDLATQGYSGLSRSNLVSFRKFAFIYAALAKNQTLSGLFKALAEGVNFEFGRADEKSQTLSGFSETSTSSAEGDPFSTSVQAFPSLEARADSVESFAWKNDAYYLKLFRVVSWSNLMELCRIDDPLKRTFYELECVKSAWSNRELKRQMNSMLFERVGLSRDVEAVMALSQQGQLIDNPAMVLRDPYILEFLGLEERSTYSESELEAALIEHLQEFIHELGRDFCFIERQFRITVANKHHFLDLLFFHRRLRCLVAIDLKLGGFEAAHAGQMNLYLNYLKEEVAFPDENPPVGIILCSEKDAEEVHFATAGMDSQLFVSRYLVALPSEEKLKQWLREEQNRLQGGA
jgi:predicted nuclease of restriction endonuclease-like (RecB) superfamily